MTLDEQLAMAVNTVPNAVPQQPISNEQLQAQAQVVQPTVTAPVQPTPVASVSPVQISQTISTPVQTFDLDQATEEVQNQEYGVMEIQLGEKVNTRPIDPVKRMEKGEKIRFTILSNKIGACKVHNHPTLNKIACFSTDTHYGKCCQDMDEPKIRYYIPVLVYSTMPGDPRTPLPQGKSELRLLIIWDKGSYDQLTEELINGNWQMDFIATCEDTFGKLSFRGQHDSFRSTPEYAKAIVEAEQKWEAVKSRAVSVVRRNMDEAKYIRLTMQAPVPQLQQYDGQDIFNPTEL